MSNHQPQSAGAGPPSAGMGMQHGPGGQGPPPPAQNMSQQNLNQIVRAFDPFSHVPVLWIPKSLLPIFEWFISNERLAAISNGSLYLRNLGMDGSPDPEQVSIAHCRWAIEEGSIQPWPSGQNWCLVRNCGPSSGNSGGNDLGHCPVGLNRSFVLKL
jgi:hypothetical protein